VKDNGKEIELNANPESLDMNKTEAMIDSSLISKILHDLTTFRRLGYEVSYTYTQILKSKMSASAVGVIAAFCSHRDGSGQH